MKKLRAGFTIVLLLLMCQQARSQCLSAAEMLADVAAIQASATTTNGEKIKQLRRLQELFLRCHPTKDSVYARIVHRLGDIYFQTGDVETAIRYTKEAVAVNARSKKQLTERSFLANSYLNLGMFYKDLNLLNEARYYFDSCTQISINFPDKYFIAFMAFERKAYISFQMGDYQNSIETGDNGILFAKAIKDPLAEASLLLQKAQAQTELNDINDAEKNITKAIAVFSAAADTIRLATTYSIYANLLYKKGEPQGSVRYYQRSFELNKATGNWQQCSRDMLDLGFVYDNKLSNSAKAIGCYRHGIKLLEQAPDPYQLTGLYINIGVVHWRQKNYTQALHFYQKALNALPINFTDTSIKSNPSENMLRLVANDYFVSILLSNKGEALLEQYKKEKNRELLKTALTTYQTADVAVDLMRWKQSGEQSKLYWREKTKKMYENAIEVCYLLNDSEKGYYFFEKSRAVLLTDKLSELGAKKFIAPGDRGREQQLRINLFSLKQQLLLLNEEAAEYSVVKQQFLSAQQEWEGFIRSLEKKYPVYYQYKYNNAVQPFSAVRSMLQQNNQSLIEFFTADSIVYVLFISPANTKLLKIHFKEYGAVAKEFMEICSDRSKLNSSYSRYRTLANRLYETLFKPLNVPEGRVIISADDHLFPFDALLSDVSTPNSFLLKKYAFSYAYSMGVLFKGRTKLTATGNSFLGVAPVNYQTYQQLQSLNGADQSLKHIQPHFNTARLLIDKSATKQNFLSNVAQYRTVQIYSHADADSAGKQPVLYLYDSVLNLSEIQELQNMHTDMIVLSACNTGVGKNAKGEGVFSLARAFMSAGIPSTVTTLWQVDNKATYQLTEAFYKHLNTGLPKDVAMQKAKLEFIEGGDPVLQMPYYWAANILLGNTSTPPVETASTENKMVLPIVLSFLLLTAILVIFFAKQKALRKNF